ncbi:MAG: hypothetical protein HUU20_12065 [Pirellulales bacterium]|nr:hypothetical protein [Pirellulales bacterium]
MQQQKCSTEGDVDAARARLANARYNACLVWGEPEAASEQLRILVAVNERELQRERALHECRAASEASLERSQGRLAYARSLLAEKEGDIEIAVEQLRIVVAMRMNELDRFQDLHRRRQIAVAEVDAAQCRVAYARHRLARAEGNSAKAIAELQTLIALHEMGLTRLTEVQRHAAVSEIDMTVGRWYAAEARLRLAMFKEQHAAAKQELQQLVAIDRALLELVQKRSTLLGGGPASWEEGAVVELQWQLDFDRHRLAKGAVGEYIHEHPPDVLWF